MRYVLAFSLIVVGCSGTIGDKGGEGPGGGDGPSGGKDAPGSRGEPVGDEPPTLTSFSCDEKVAGGSQPRLWRLTERQYANSLADALHGRPEDGAADLSARKVTASLFKGDIVEGDRYTTAALTHGIREQDLGDVLGNSGSFAYQLVERLSRETCLGNEAIAGCLPRLIESTGAILFRRPLTKAEIETYTKLAIEAEPLSTKKDAAALAFSAMLAAPQFLFRVELGTKGRMDNFEVASAIALSLTDRPPDAQLWSAAMAGELTNKDAIKKHVERLLDSPSSSVATVQFFHQWLRFDAAKSIDKKSNNHRPTNLIAQSNKLISELVAQNLSEGMQEALFTTRMSFVDKDTAGVYGVQTASKTLEPIQTEGERMGVLAQPSWLAGHSQPERTDPIRRGRFVREEILCEEVPEIDITQVAPLSEDPALTMRQKLSAHQTDPSCAGCHRLLDPIGLGMESFDHLGNFRSTEADRPLDNSGELVDSGDQDGPFKGMDGLSAKLAKSRKVGQCMMRQSFRYWLGRTLNEGDGCSLVEAEKAFVQGKGNYRAALVAMFTSDAFLNKRR
ncbi:MAG: DUF1588 domain-containing protein [Deltaproteobacteria bacterium]|nr:DUF1588 domain-containing protein [Deltaproteobacteria bacterium]